jgi:hypothetical protein
MKTEQKYDVYYVTIYVRVILKDSVKVVDSFLYHTINDFPKRDSPAFIVHTTTHFTHFIVHIYQKNMTYHWKLLSLISSCHIHTILLRQHFLDAKTKCSISRRIPHSFMEKTNITRHYCNHNNIHYTHHSVCITLEIIKWDYRTVFRRTCTAH